VAPNSEENKDREHKPVTAGAVHHGRQHTTPKAEATQPSWPAEVAEASPNNKLEPTVKRAGELILPSSVISRGDIAKSLREVEKINTYFHQEGLRGSKDQPLPTLGRVLESLATANNLNLIHTKDRDELKRFLTRLKAKAPVVFMSFPSEASDDFIAKLLDWFRAEVHPYIILNVGLQPELAAGCTLRTTNKFFDFSFRNRFENSKKKLLAALKALDQAPDRTAIADATATNQENALVSGGAAQ